MIREWFYNNVCQPVKKCYNYITRKTGEPSDTHVTSEGSSYNNSANHVDDSLLPQENISTSGDNDIL